MLPNKNAAAPQNSGEFVGVHWALPCELPCAGANRHSKLLPALVSRPGDCHLSHESGAIASWRHAHRRLVVGDRRALDRGGDEHRRHALHGGAVYFRPQGADDTVKKGKTGVME